VGLDAESSSRLTKYNPVDLARRRFSTREFAVLTGEGLVIICMGGFRGGGTSVEVSWRATHLDTPYRKENGEGEGEGSTRISGNKNEKNPLTMSKGGIQNLISRSVRLPNNFRETNSRRTNSGVNCLFLSILPRVLPRYSEQL
jgi:hypothetical protein